MNISRENIYELNAVIKVIIEKKDYEKNVADKLKEYRRKAALPGFRPGYVPASIIQRRFGKAILAEEVNQLLSQNLANFIKTENLSILGEPLPNETDQKPIDWENDQDFEFIFDVGLSPHVEISLSKERIFPYYRIKVTEEMIDNRVENILNQMGSNAPVEEVGENSLVKGDFHQLDEEENEIPEGISPKGVLVSVEMIKDEAVKKDFVGRKNGEILVFDPVIAFDNRHEVGHMLNISHEEAESLNSRFRFVISEILKFEPAEISEELLIKLYGENSEVKTPEDFRSRVKDEIASSFSYSSEQKFFVDTKNKLLGETEIILPEEFLKRWLKAANKGISVEEIDKDFSSFLTDLRWQLIKNSIVRSNDLKVDDQEIMQFARQLAYNQYNQHGIYDVSEENLDRLANLILEKDEEKERIYRTITENKVMQVIKDQAETEFHEISREEFSEMLKEGKTD